MSGPVRTFDEARARVLRHMADRPAPPGHAWATFDIGREDGRAFAVDCNNARAVASRDPRDLFPGMPVFLVDKATGRVEEADYQSNRARIDAMAPVAAQQG